MQAVDIWEKPFVSAIPLTDWNWKIVKLGIMDVNICAVELSGIKLFELLILQPIGLVIWVLAKYSRFY